MDFLRIHPIYKNFGYDIKLNRIVHVSTNNEVKQRLHSSGYSLCTVYNGANHKTYLCHRFIWECCNDIIPKFYEIDHIDKNRLNNNILNLRCITRNENRKNRDHTNITKIGKIAHQMKRFIKAINIDTNDVICFKSKSQCAKFFGISPALIYLIIEHKNRVKTANSDKGKYTFEYIDENDVVNLKEIPHGRLGKIYKNKEI